MVLYFQRFIKKILKIWMNLEFRTTKNILRNQKKYPKNLDNILENWFEFQVFKLYRFLKEFILELIVYGAV